MHKTKLVLLTAAALLAITSGAEAAKVKRSSGFSMGRPASVKPVRVLTSTVSFSSSIWPNSRIPLTAAFSLEWTLEANMGTRRSSHLPSFS